MGDRDVSGTAESSSLSIVLFLSSCFRTVLRYRFAHSAWMLAFLDGDWGHDDAGETEKSSRELRNWIWFVLQRVECKSLPGLKQTFGPGLIRFRDTHLPTEPLSFTYKLFVIINHSLEEKLNHWDLLPFLLPCFSSALLLSGQSDGRSGIDAHCSSLNRFILL